MCGVFKHGKALFVCIALVLAAHASQAGSRDSARVYSEVLSSKNPRAITQRIIKHPDTQLSAMVGIKVHVEFATIMGEPTVFCPAVWWLDEIYDASGGIASVHKRRISSIPDNTISELDFYKPKLIIELKSGHLMRCDAGVMAKAFSEKPSFTVPSSRSWSKLFFYDESSPRYVDAQEAKGIWRDLLLRKQASRYAISHIRVARNSAINLWSLARLREQEAMAAYSDKVQQLEDQNAAPSDIEAMREKISEHASRFRQAFNSGMGFSSRFSRQRQVERGDCAERALQAMNTLRDSGAVAELIRQCIEPQSSTSVGSIQHKRVKARLVGHLEFDRERDQVVRALSHGAIVQRYNELFLIAANGIETNLDLILPPRYRMSSGQVLELEQGSFLAFNGTDSVHRFDRNGAELQRLKLIQRGGFIVASNSRYWSLEIIPGPRGEPFVAFLSGKRRGGAVYFNVVQLRGQRLQSIYSEQDAGDQGSNELEAELYGPNYPCWASASILDKRAEQRAVQQRCIRADGSVLVWSDGMIREHAEKPQRETGVPLWVEQEIFSGHDSVFFASESMGEDAKVFIRRASWGRSSELNLGMREKVLAADSEGACFSTGRRMSASVLRFYCFD